MLTQRRGDGGHSCSSGGESRAWPRRVERALAASIVALLTASVGVAKSVQAGPGRTTSATTPGSAVAGGLVGSAGSALATADGAPGHPGGDHAPTSETPASEIVGGESTLDGASDPTVEVAEPLWRLASLRLTPRVVWPADGPLTGWFGEPRGRRQHDGIDICAPVGAPVRAAADGTVAVAASSVPGYGGYGTIVVIDQGDGVTTLYAHLSAVHVAPGRRVAVGDDIGAVGMTGSVTAPHLHFEVRVAGTKIDPSAWLSSAGAGGRPRHSAR